MSQINWTNVTDHAAALSAVGAAARADILAYVNTFVNVDKFGGEDSAKTKLVRIFLAAHYGQSELDAPSGGVVSEENYGAESIQVRYSQKATEDQLVETSFGRRYLALVRRSAARVGIVPR